MEQFAFLEIVLENNSLITVIFHVSKPWFQDPLTAQVFHTSGSSTGVQICKAYKKHIHYPIL